MNNLNPTEEKICKLFEEAHQLKEIARKSTENLEPYVRASTRLARAALLSKKLANTNSNLEAKIQHRAFGEYYRYEEHYCLGSYYYEKHETRKAAKHFRKASFFIGKALRAIENLPSSVTPDVRHHLVSNLANWKHFQFTLEIHILGCEARASWDSEQFVAALDRYREIARLQGEHIESEEFSQLSEQYRRIALGNHAGAMMNASQAMVGIIFGNGQRRPGKTVKLPFELIVELVKNTLAAYRYGSSAFARNPEWLQFYVYSQNCLANVQNLMRNDPALAEKIVAALQDEPELIRVVKRNFAAAREDASTPPTEKIKLLFLCANPANTTALQLDEEIRAIQQKINASEHRDLIQMEAAMAVRADDLLQSMNQHCPDIVHFSGHANDTGIVICDEFGVAKLVNSDALVALFESTLQNVKVVVLNACYSKAQAEAIASVIPCAIGMNSSIGDEAARVFAGAFYRAIGFGKSVAVAFNQGVAALKLEGTNEASIPELIEGPGVNAAELFVLESKIAKSAATGS